MRGDYDGVMLSSIAEQIHKKKSKAHSVKQKKEFLEKVGLPFALVRPRGAACGIGQTHRC